MSNLVFKSKKRENMLLQAGRHLVTIIGIQLTMAAKQAGWNDQTPQLAVKYRGADGHSITDYKNLKGFKKFSDLTEKEQQSGNYISASSKDGNEGYAVDKATGNRVEDTNNTAKCMEIVANLGCDAGIVEDTDFEIEELEGRKLTVVVAPVGDKGNLGVTRTEPAAAIEEEAEALVG